MSPILTRTLATPKVQQNLNMFLGGKGRKHSEAFQTKTSNKKHTASVTNTNTFLNAAQEISDDSDDDDDDDEVFIENTQHDKENRTIAKAKRTTTKDKYTADMEKKQRKAENKKNKELNKRIENNYDNDEPLSDADFKRFMFNMNKAVDNLQKGQQESQKIITKEIERTVSNTVEKSIGNINSRLNTVEADMQTLKDAELLNKATRDFAKTQAETNKSHEDAIDRLTEDMLKQSAEMENMKKEMLELKTNGMTTPNMQPGQSSDQGNGSINFIWETELTKINQENEYNLVLIFGQHLKQVYKSIINDNIAKEVMIKLHKEVIRRFNLQGTHLDKFNGIKFKKTMANNIVKVYFDNFTDKASYKHLITQLPYNIRPYVDQSIPPPYTECYRQFKDIAFDIRASGEYKTNIRIISNWMVIMSQKKSDDNNNPWERVPGMEFYPPVPGSKEHKDQKISSRNKTSANNANQDQTLINTGDLEKIRKTVCISTQPLNIIPDIKDAATQQEFMGFIAVKLTEAKIKFENKNIKWNDRNVSIQLDSVQNAWVTLNALLGTEVQWPQSSEKLSLKCSLLGYKPVPSRNQRKNSFLSN